MLELKRISREAISTSLEKVECTKVCPEGITITDNAILPLKERIVDEYYDPIKKLLGIFRGRA